MGMSLSRQWSLAVCGLVAHADREFDESEIDQLMAMLEDQQGSPEYASWLETLADPSRLRELVDQLERPPLSEAREILQQAWIVSMIDGEQCDDERRVLRGLSAKLGIEGPTFDAWGELWTSQLLEDAELITATLTVSLGDATPAPEKRKLVQRVLRGLPLDDLGREELLASTILPLSIEAVASRLHNLDRTRRMRVFRTASATLPLASDLQTSRGRLLGLAADAGLDEHDTRL